MFPVDTEELPIIQGSSLVTQTEHSRTRSSSLGTDKLTVVLMAGLPCTGKTELAYALSEQLKGEVIDKDLYKEGLMRSGIDDDTASKEAYKRSFKKMLRVLKKQNKPVILDSAALRPFILYAARKIVDAVPGSQLKVILCVADRDTRVKRLKARSYDHPNPKVDTTIDVDELYHFQHLPADRLILHTTMSRADCLAEALKYIKS